MCLHTVVVITALMCSAVLLTLAAMLTLYAISARRRRRSTSSRGAAFPLPVGDSGAPRHSWLATCSRCHAHLPSPMATVDHCRPVEQKPRQLQNSTSGLVTSCDQNWTSAASPPPPLTVGRPSNSESNLLLVDRNTWTC